MSDALDRAVDARLDQIGTIETPSFDDLVTRRHRRARRQVTIACLAVAVAAAGLALLQPWQESTPRNARLAVDPSTGPTPSTPNPSDTQGATKEVSQAQDVTFALVSADGRRITVNARGGGCTRDAHLEAEQSTDEVGLRLTAEATNGAGGGCTSDLKTWQRSTELDSPLAQRRLRDFTSGELVPHFDGRALASLSWLPDGSSAPADRPDGAGWARIYNFPGQRSAAPVVVIQSPGDLLRSDRFQGGGALEASDRQVHGHHAVLIVQRDDHGSLLQSRLGWVEGAYTYEIDSMPDWAYQRPLQPNKLQRIADGLEPAP